MSETSKVNNWSFPFKTAGENSKEVTDPQLYFDALAKAENGYYPLGANGLWHGGVHFDKGTGALLNQSEVRCIADGEVVAYRIDKQYPRTSYGTTQSNSDTTIGAPYSTGFVLVKHRLELPSPPVPASSTEEATSSPATPEPQAAASSDSEALTFYSLYMHLLDWAGYQAQPTLKRPAFWGDGLYKVKETASDKVLGLNVREHYKVGPADTNYAKYQNKLTTLPRGTKVVTGETSPDGKWLKVVSVTPAIAGLPSNAGWVFKTEMKKLAENNYLVSESVSKDAPALEQLGLNVRESANAHGEILAVLPRGTQVRIGTDGATGKYRKLDAIVSGSAVPPLMENAEGKLPGYIWLDSLETQQTPSTDSQDAVYVLSSPYKIKAGELIGHLGLYQDHDQPVANPRLHLEVFSCDDVPAFIAKSQERAATLPEAKKTLIKVHKGSTIIQPVASNAQIESGQDVRLCSDSPKEGRWVKVQKYATCIAEKSTELGSISSGSYSLNATQKGILATRMGVAAADMPDKVDFLKIYFNSADGNDPQNYTGGNIPASHSWRKVGATVGNPTWVERAKLNAQGHRISNDEVLPAWTHFPLQSSSNGAKSGFDRILPAASWDGLPHEAKAIDHDKVRWWYVTVGDEAGNDASGWAPEKDLIVTRHSPWEWPGFSLIQEAATPADLHARSLQAEGNATSEEMTLLQGRVDIAERGPLLQKLYDIIDQSNATKTRDGLLTRDEFKAALNKPWLAQQLSLLITQYESEWLRNDAKWNDLDVHMADDLVEWGKEKERIKKLAWWDSLANRHEIQKEGLAWHFHPVGLIGCLHNPNVISCTKCGRNISLTYEFFKEISYSSASDTMLAELANNMNFLLKKYEANSCSQIKHLLAQAKKETKGFSAFREPLNYVSYTGQSLYAMAPTAINNGFIRKEITFSSHEEKIQWIQNHLINNDAAYGEHAFGSDEQPGKDYRGRGLLHLTHYNTYKTCGLAIQSPIHTNPELVESDPKIIVETGLWFWKENKLKNIAEDPSLTIDEAVTKITLIINGGYQGLEERKQFMSQISTVFAKAFGGPCA